MLCKGKSDYVGIRKAENYDRRFAHTQYVYMHVHVCCRGFDNRVPIHIYVYFVVYESVTRIYYSLNRDLWFLNETRWRAWANQLFSRLCTHENIEYCISVNTYKLFLFRMQIYSTKDFGKRVRDGSLLGFFFLLKRTFRGNIGFDEKEKASEYFKTFKYIFSRCILA